MSERYLWTEDGKGRRVLMRADEVREPASPTPSTASSTAGASGLPGLPDDVLADRARDGDSRAFEVLLRRYERRMFTLALRITASRVDAEDAVQAGFTAAWRHLPSFRADAAFATWLYRIVTNEAVAVLRRRRPEDALPESARELPEPRKVDDPEVHAQSTALADALTRALGELPVDLRVVWLLREVDGCSYDEVAAIVGQNVSTVRGRIARARQALAGLMQDWR